MCQYLCPSVFICGPLRNFGLRPSAFGFLFIAHSAVAQTFCQADDVWVELDPRGTLWDR
jgi:hypothetical protein